jgi:multicomponent Na+:H+ antiporter subunit D
MRPPKPIHFSPWMVAPVVAMAALTVFIGIFPEPVYQLARAAADELLDPGAYVYTVVGHLP